MAQDHKVGDSKARNAAKSSRLLAMKWPCQKLAANCSGKGTASWGMGAAKKFEMAKSVPPCLALFGRSRDRAGNKRPKII